jgi:hypothetical protein
MISTTPRLRAWALRGRFAEAVGKYQSQAIKIAVLPPCRAKVRARFLADFAVTAMKSHVFFSRLYFVPQALAA